MPRRFQFGVFAAVCDFVSRRSGASLVDKSEIVLQLESKLMPVLLLSSGPGFASDLSLSESPVVTPESDQHVGLRNLHKLLQMRNDSFSQKATTS